MATATLDSTNAAGASLRASCACVATAAIAQLGERQTEDLKVPGSIPGLGILAHSNVTCCASAPAMNATNHARTPRARCRPRARPGAAVHVRVCVVEWHDSRFWSGRSQVQFPKQPLRQHRRTDDANHGLAQDTLPEWSEGAAWVQIPQVSHVTPKCTSMALACGAKGIGQRPCAATTAVGTPSEWLHPPWGSNPRPQG